MTRQTISAAPNIIINSYGWFNILQACSVNPHCVSPAYPGYTNAPCACPMHTSCTPHAHAMHTPYTAHVNYALNFTQDSLAVPNSPCMPCARQACPKHALSMPRARTEHGLSMFKHASSMLRVHQVCLKHAPSTL